MKKIHLLGALCACMITTYVAPASAITIDYSNTSGSSVNLDPTNDCGGIGTVGCFSFDAGNSIQITSGTATGFTGGISGIFGVGAISTTGPLQMASASGTGVLTIFDGSTLLSADLSWVDIASFAVAGILNTNASANLTNISYSGSNSDLLALFSAGAGINTATFQFTTPTSLTALFTTSSTVTSTSFSGSITPIPVPAAVWLFGSGLLGLVGIARRKA